MEIVPLAVMFVTRGRRKLKEVVRLIEDDEDVAGRHLTESREGKRRAYRAVALGYKVLLEEEKAVWYMKKELSYSDTEDTAFVDKRRLLNLLMRSLWHLGRMEEVRKYAKEFLQLLEEYNRGDCFPEETFEEGFTADNCWSKLNLSDLFLASFFSGDYETAKSYCERMKACEFCWNCMNATCVEEVRGEENRKSIIYHTKSCGNAEGTEANSAEIGLRNGDWYGR